MDPELESRLSNKLCTQYGDRFNLLLVLKRILDHGAAVYPGVPPPPEAVETPTWTTFANEAAAAQVAWGGPLLVRLPHGRYIVHDEPSGIPVLRFADLVLLDKGHLHVTTNISVPRGVHDERCSEPLKVMVWPYLLSKFYAAKVTAPPTEELADIAGWGVILDHETRKQLLHHAYLFLPLHTHKFLYFRHGIISVIYPSLAPSPWIDTLFESVARHFWDVRGHPYPTSEEEASTDAAMENFRLKIFETPTPHSAVIPILGSLAARSARSIV